MIHILRGPVINKEILESTCETKIKKILACVKQGLGKICVQCMGIGIHYINPVINHWRQLQWTHSTKIKL